MTRRNKWILCLGLAGVITSGWNLWKLQALLHIRPIHQLVPAKPDIIKPDLPNDGSSYSFQLAHEKRLKQQ